MNYLLGIKLNSYGFFTPINESTLTEEWIQSLFKSKSRLWFSHRLQSKIPESLSSIAISVSDSDEDFDEKGRFKRCPISYVNWLAKEGGSLLEQELRKSKSPKLLFTEQGKLLYGNSAALHLLGLKQPVGIRLDDFQIKNENGTTNSGFSASEGDYEVSFKSLGNDQLLNISVVHLLREGGKYILLQLALANQTETTIKHKILLEQSLGAYVILNPEGKVQFASEEIQNIIGHPPKELINNICSNYQHPEDQPFFEKALQEVLQNPSSRKNIKYRVLHADGHYRWVRTNISNRMSDPLIKGLVMMVQDIDYSEKELLNSNQRFKWASKATKDVIWDWRFKEETIAWGENLKEMFGWNESDLNTTEKWMNFIPAEDHREIDASLNEAFSNGSEIWICRYRFLKSNGEYAYILDRGYIERNSEGEAIRLIGAMHDYSEQHFFERELKAEQQKFQQLFEYSLIGAAMLDLESLKWKDCNQSLLNILGFKREEFLNLSWKDLIPKAEQVQNDEKINQLLANQSIKAYQSTWLRKDLVTTRLVVSAFTTTDENAKPIAWFHLLDLGPIEESNKALVEAESRFRQYIEKASDIFITLSSDGAFEYISPNLQLLLGYTPSELIGSRIQDFIHESERTYALLAFRRAYNHPGTTYRFVFRILAKSGEWIWVEANGSFQAKESELKAFINVRDIRKEHEAEEELRKLSLVANRTSNGVLIVDANHKVEWINESFAHISGYSLDEIKGFVMEDLIHGQNSIRTNDKRLKNFLDQGKPIRFENINYKKDGSEYWVESIVTPIYNERGKLVNYISIETDITARKLEELDFQRNLRLISEQNERLRSFAHIVSHNFRSHGSNIHQLIHELNVTTDQILKEELHSFLEVSSNGLMQALDELAGLLEVESASDLPTQELNVLEYCKRIRQILSRPTMEAKAELIFDIPSNFTINFYPAYFESVLFNLVSNALRYHNPEKNPWVKVSAWEDREAKYLTVADNGIGFDAEKHRDEIFKFKKSIHNHPDSSGIGLYLVRSQVESLGGDIHVESASGKGSTFKIRIPK